MLHRFDIHMHSWYSADASDPPERLIAAARAAGLSGIAITDHNNCDVHHYLRESGVVNAQGQTEDGFLVLPGVEISTASGHILCIGALVDGMCKAPAQEAIQAIRQAGGLAIPAHPFDRWRAGVRPPLLDRLAADGLLDAIEVFNAAVTARSYNRQAKEFALARNLPMTAGSDAHLASAVGVATTALELDKVTIPAVLGALKTPGNPREENYLSRLEGVKKHFGNWFRVANAGPPPRRKPPA